MGILVIFDFEGILVIFGFWGYVGYFLGFRGILVILGGFEAILLIFWVSGVFCAQSITAHGIPCHYNTRIGVGRPFRYYAKSNGKKNDHEFPSNW